MTNDSNTADRLLQATRKAINTASFRANQYKQVVQKKIDLGAIHKKVEQLHSELGKQVDDAYQAQQSDLLANPEVARLLEKLVNLKQAAALLEEEIEQIREETAPIASEQAKAEQQEATENKQTPPQE